LNSLQYFGSPLATEAQIARGSTQVDVDELSAARLDRLEDVGVVAANVAFFFSYRSVAHVSRVSDRILLF
jgi:uncharacterized iron-regulated protein